MSSPSDIAEYASVLLVPFQKPGSQLDDILVASLIGAFILLVIITKRIARKRRTAARHKHVNKLISKMLDMLGPYGATGIRAAWWGSTERLDLEIEFGNRSFFLSGFLQIDPLLAAAGILEAYRVAMEGAEQHPIEEESVESERQEEPQPVVAKARGWREILGVGQDATRHEIKLAYRSLAMRHHPDLGGDVDEMARINAARDEGMASTG